jgi:Adenylate cyclase, family 3 (some proteins contain HAMP domain)
MSDGKVTGLATQICLEVANHAGPDEIVVSSTVKDLVAGSGIEFVDKGTHKLAGISGEWRLFAVGRL